MYSFLEEVFNGPPLSVALTIAIVTLALVWNTLPNHGIVQGIILGVTLLSVGLLLMYEGYRSERRRQELETSQSKSARGRS